MLQGLVDQDIIVRLKWNETEYKGKLVSLDSYLNLQLSGTVEYINDKETGDLGQVLIRYDSPGRILPSMAHRLTRDRCNNVLWIRAANQGGVDTKMEG